MHVCVSVLSVAHPFIGLMDGLFLLLKDVVCG